MLNVTNIPAPRVPFIDERTGLMAREWYRFFLNLFTLAGGGNNPISLEEVQLGPPNQPDLTELLIQINQNIAPQYEDQSGDFLATLDTAQLMSMMARFENAEAAIQGAYLHPVVQTGTIANYNLDGSPTAGGIVYGTGPALAVSAAGTVGQVLTSAGAGTPTWATAAAGTVTSVSVVSANGLAGTVATATTTPAITLSTTITGLLKGNGTAISAATSGTDYAPATSGTSILYGNAAGGFNNVTIGTGVSFVAGTLSATGSGGTVTSVSGTGTVNGITLTGTVTSSGSLTLGGTLSGTASGLTAGNVTTNANLTGPITSVGNATSVAAQTGTGSTFVMNTSPTLITPILGVAAATSINFGVSALATYSESQSWTPNQGSGLTVVGAFSSFGTYTRVGNMITANGYVSGATSVAVAATGDLCSNLPVGAGGTTIFFGGAANNSISVFSQTLTSTQRLISLNAIGATTRIYFSVNYTV
jgi:hypothetical protein